MFRKVLATTDDWTVTLMRLVMGVIFFAHGAQLQDLACHAVYTVSIETFYSHSGLGNVFSKHVLLPNIKLQRSKTDAKLFQPGMDGMIEVIARRLAADTLLPTPGLKENFVTLSGGSVRQMIRLLQESVLSAQSRRIEIIDGEALKDAAQRLQQGFQRSLEEDDYKLLAHTEKTKNIKKDDEYMRLLRNTAIMEYNGSEVWYNVNPLIQPIDAFKAAKKQLQTSSVRRSRIHS